MKIIVIEEGGTHILEEDILIDDQESSKSLSFLNINGNFDHSSDCDYDYEVFEERIEDDSLEFDY